MKRILTALVALPILLYTVWSGIPYFFIALTAIAALIALYEFYNLAAKVACRPTRIAGYAAGLLIIYLLAADEPGWIVAALAGLTIISFLDALREPDHINASLASVASTLFGVIYVALLAGFLAGVRMIGHEDGAAGASMLAPKLLTMFFAMVMMTDTGAYYTGRSIGRHKLAPRVSPGKTIEGSIGGFVAAALTGPLCKLTFFPEIPMVDALLLGAAIGIIGQIGDLAESLLKRGAGVKDSGAIFPGHGGMLDRVDSILFCAPVLYYYARVFVPKW
ncbi:MAG TPA: phosphatidate cytidylyltransferase [Blastocatellia bacterium]|jgi:phosphatidate cytidylyltransferase